jgi:uncharacterized protein DUF6335
MARSARGKAAGRTRRTGSGGSQKASGRSVERPNKKAQPKRESAVARSAGRKGAKKAAAKAAAKRTLPAKSARSKPTSGTSRHTRPVARTSKTASPKTTSKQSAPVKRVTARKSTPRTGAKAPAASPGRDAAGRTKLPRLDRVRRMLDETVPTPPSSLDMDRHGSAARTGRAEMADNRDEHRGMAASIAGGDVDVNVEDAYFTGDEAPGGDNPAPDEEVVDDIGKALGVQYDDQEELKSTDKIVERDKHRWEMDPASSEDYKERK